MLNTEKIDHGEHDTYTIIGLSKDEPTNMWEAIAAETRIFTNLKDWRTDI